MANIKGKAQVTTSRQGASEGEDVYLRALRDGSMINVDWKQAGYMGGFAHYTKVGSLSTGIAGGGAASIIDIDRPRFVLAIPNGVSIYPTRISVQCGTGTPATGGEAEILIAVDQDGTLAGGGSTAGTIYNLNTLAAKPSACVASHTYTTTLSADPVFDIELARKVIEFSVLANGQDATPLDLVYEPENPICINGIARLVIYFGGDAALATTHNFCQIEWLEFPENYFKV